MNRSAFFFMLSIVVPTILGCGGAATEPLPPTAEVTGTVTLGGEPVEGASVSFVNGGYADRATTDASGKYTVNAYLGKNKISVSKTEVFETGETMMMQETDEEGNTTEKEEKVTDTKHLLPSQYSSANSTPLQLVVEETNKPFDIALE